MPDLTAHHYGLIVSDLDRAVAFYRDTLGLEVLSEFTVSGAAFAEAVDVPGATGRFAHLDAGGARVELVEYDPPGEDRPAPAVNDAGGTHLGLSVPDLDAFHDGLPEEVATLSAPRTTESGTRICFLRDPEGNLVEVVEV